MISSQKHPINSRLLILTTAVVVFVLTALSILTIVSPGTSGLTTIYVDDDAPEGGNGTVERPFNSIQNATNDATAGDTIRVFNGTYGENVVIDRQLTLIGNGSEETIINGSNSGNVVTVNSEWVNISHVKVEASGSGYWDAGIRINQHNVSVFEANCSGNNRGIIAWVTENGSIHNTTCDSNTRNGIILFGSQDFTMNDNVCRWNEYGIYLTNSNTNNASKNGCEFNEYGIYLSNSNGNRFHGNILDSNEIGFNMVNSDTNSVQGTEITWNTENGILLSDAHDNTFTGLLVDNNTIGIDIDGANGNTVLNSAITGNGEGVRLRDSASDNVFMTSSLLNNIWWGINATDNDGESGDARNTWWGVDTGPYHPFLNPEGEGDNVTDNVLFDPWTGKPMNVHNVDKDELYVTIQEAIEDADPGDTIEVYAGTFRESITVDKQLSIIGAGAGGRAEETIIDGQGLGNVVTLEADGVNLSGFTIIGSGPGQAGIVVGSDMNRIFENNLSGHRNGIFLDTADDNMVYENTITGNYRGILLQDSSTNSIGLNDLGMQQYQGIALYDSPGNSMYSNSFHEGDGSAEIYLSGSDDNWVYGNIITNSGGSGIHLLKAHSNRIEMNEVRMTDGGIGLEQSKDTIIDSNSLERVADQGIFLLNGDSNYIVNNTCTECGIGIFIGEDSIGNSVEDNLCRNGTEGILLTIADQNSLWNNSCENNTFGIRLIRSDQITIVGGMIMGGETGIDVFDGSEILMTMIIIGESAGIGINVSSSSQIGIHNTTLSNNAIGLMAGESAGITVHGNNIMGSLDMGIDATGMNPEEPVDATFNYWGDPTGPYHAVNNSGGSGDEVTDGVEFVPWLGGYQVWAAITWVSSTEVLQGENINFEGIGVSHFADIVRYSWTSSLDGELLNGTKFVMSISSLSNGTHIIGFRAQDENGVWSAPSRVQVHVNGVPRVSIDHIPTWALEGEDVTLAGFVDEDGSIERYIWRSDKEGELYNSSNPHFVWKGVSKGERILTFQVLDTSGVYSNIARMNFSVYALPVATIESIMPGKPVHDDALRFTGKGSASNPVVRYVWTSDIQGTLYDGPLSTFELPGLENGTHLISFRIMDEVGLWSEETSRTLNVNRRPMAILVSISPNPAVPGDSVTFHANGTDDGEVLQYSWTSDLDGMLNNGSETTYSTKHLSFGVHTITLQVKDDKGIWSHGVSEVVILTMRPTAFIDKLSPNPVPKDMVLHVSGHGSDDGSVVMLRWTSSLDGILTTTNLTESGITLLSPGIHIISLTVQDNDGVWSDPATGSVEVLDDGPPTMTITSPEQDALVGGVVTITGTASDDKGLARIEYQIEGAGEWKSIPGDKEAWTLNWDTAKLSNGTHTLRFRAFDGVLFSNTLNLSLEVRNDGSDGETDPESDDGPDTWLLAASFGLVLIIIFAIGLLMFRSPPPKTGRKQEDGKDASMNGPGKQPGPASGTGLGDGSVREPIGDTPKEHFRGSQGLQNDPSSSTTQDDELIPLDD